MTEKIPVITIDGPSGSGKGTISQLLAQKLGWHFLDSGALYRVLAFAARKQGIHFTDTKSLVTLAKVLDVQFRVKAPEIHPQVILASDDISDAIRSEQCGNDASMIAANPEIRKALVDRQREFRRAPGLVADGRDMGSVIFSDANLKLFLEASPLERSRRRYNQLKEKGINVSLGQVLAEIDIRDKRDKERAVSPLQPAQDAIIIDTTGLTIAEVLQRAVHAWLTVCENS